MKEIVERYKKIHKSGLNLKYFDDFGDFKNEIKQTSMFKEKKLAVLPNLFLNPEFKEKFLEGMKDFLKSDDIILVYQEGEFNKNDSLFKLLKEKAKSQEFELLTGQKLKSWIKKEFEKYKTKIDSKILEMLIEYVGNDLWRQSNEIRKLALFKQKKMVEVKDVKLLVKPKIETDIFKTIDAVAEKDKKGALNLLHKHLEKGDSPLYILAMINYQFRNLLMVKSSDMSKIKIHPFVLKKSYYQSQKFTLEELKKIYQKIFQVDLDIKTGKIEPELALDLFIAEL